MWEAGNASAARQILENQRTNLRGFEWHYWDQQTHRERTSVQLPVESRQGSAYWIFSGDGTRLARIQRLADSFGRPVAVNEKIAVVVTVFDVATQKVLRTHEIKSFRASLGIADENSLLSHDGNRVLVSNPVWTNVGTSSYVTGYQLYVFDVKTDEVLLNRTLEKELPVTLNVHRREFTPDGRELVVGLVKSERPPTSPEGLNILRLTGAEIAVFDLDAGEKEEPLTIRDAAFGSLSTDGTRILGATPLPGERQVGDFLLRNPERKIWDAATGKKLLSFKAAGAVRFSSDDKELIGATLAAGPESDRLQLTTWDAATGNERGSVPLPFPRRGPGPGPNRRTNENHVRAICHPGVQSGRLAVGGRSGRPFLAGAASTDCGTNATICS